MSPGSKKDAPNRPPKPLELLSAKDTSLVWKTWVAPMGVSQVVVTNSGFVGRVSNGLGHLLNSSSRRLLSTHLQQQFWQRSCSWTRTPGSDRTPTLSNERTLQYSIKGGRQSETRHDLQPINTPANIILKGFTRSWSYHQPWRQRRPSCQRSPGSMWIKQGWNLIMTAVSNTNNCPLLKEGDTLQFIPTRRRPLIDNKNAPQELRRMLSQRSAWMDPEVLAAYGWPKTILTRKIWNRSF